MKHPRSHKRLAMLVLMTVTVMATLGPRRMGRAHGILQLLVPLALAADDHLELSRMSPFMMRPGVVVDRGAERLYMMNPGGGIDAIQIDTGQLLWTTRAAAKPLTIFDQRLVAEVETTGVSHTLPIALLDTSQAGHLDATIALPVVSGTAPSISSGIGSSSSVDARVQQDGLLVWWKTTSQEISGVPRPLKVQTDAGAALIDVKTHQVTTLTPEQAAARLRDAAPTSAVRTGSISADGSHYAVISVAVPSSPEGPIYLWSIYSIAGGQQLGQVRLHDATRPFFISHQLLIYESTPRNRQVNGNWIQDPVGLRGVDIKTGSEIWKRALRDASYRGTYPPHV